MATRTILTFEEREWLLSKAADTHMAAYTAAKESMDAHAAMTTANTLTEAWKLRQIRRMLAGEPNASLPQAVQS